MSLYRHPGSPYWWTLHYISGKRTRRSTRETKRSRAIEAEARYRAEAQNRRAGVGRTWDEAALRWLKEHDSKRSADLDVRILRWVTPRLTGKPLSSLTRPVLGELREERRTETSRVTANRTMCLVRSIMRAAERWEWIDRAPLIESYTLDTRDPRWVTREQIETLLPLLPEYVRPIVRFAVSTGLRKSNIVRLRWADVDLERAHVSIPSSAAKGKRPIPVPLNADALAVLMACRGKHPTLVFTRSGGPVGEVSTKYWRAAVKAAGLPGFRFHDLRHTWASWHIQKGTSLSELQALGAWRSLTMVQRYAHLSSASLRAAAARIEQPQQQPQQPQRRRVRR